MKETNLTSDPNDRFWMSEVLKLAKRSQNRTRPNPLTAAFIVKNGVCIGKGRHKKAGSPHAEVLALEAAGKQANGATLYVNLEPCTHHGSTPPCIDAIIKAKIKRVVYAIKDPNPLVKKAPAKQQLTDAGIAVSEGVLEKEAQQLNRVFFKNIQEKRPYIRLKAGLSLDGKIALENGCSKYITNPAARKVAHQLRETTDAILVGAKTIKIDNPSLNIRHKKTPQSPKFIVIIDKDASLDGSEKVFKENPKSQFILIHNQTLKKQVSSETKWSKNTEILYLETQKNHFNWESVFKRLYEKNIYDILVEGGQGIYTSLWSSDVVDEVHAFIAPKLLGGQNDMAFLTQGVSHKKIDQVPTLKNTQIKVLDDNVYIKGDVQT